MKYYLSSIFAFILLISCIDIVSGQATEKEQVKKAIFDYVEGIYNVEPDRIRRSVSRDLVKQGYYRPRTKSEYSLSPMTYEELIHTAETYNKAGRLPENAPKKITIYDISARVALARLEAIWGFDYLMLGKDDTGKWKIMQILWQSYPEKEGT